MCGGKKGVYIIVLSTKFYPAAVDLRKQIGGGLESGTGRGLSGSLLTALSQACLISLP